ncbi:PLP-dependent aminotransferase family protein [Bordetella genomosp. 12]|uniref:Aminotransferase class I/classII large domain-containing protein n=1 Tax=Bordetella genomosp. 12 TaxID=463035 RepID=A0A261VCS2_9BORD|nr:PLP-dependent aminotransferase family protein [Bordetella genomosp. 12]OZI71899.1 hypothetical protein CAL22_19140 [Bordetella genomosp. 12]
MTALAMIDDKFSHYFKNPEGSPIRALFPYLRDPAIIGFAGGNPAADVFDVPGLQDAMAEAMQTPADAWAQYSATEGLPRLRHAILGDMRRRGMVVEDASLLLTAGSQQALDLIARVLVNPGDEILVERPTYPTAIQTFKASGAQLVGVRSTADGICLAHLREILLSRPRHARPKALYCVPTYGNPTGKTFSEANRRSLLALAREFDLLIIEDDPYSALSFEPAGVSRMYDLAQGDPQTQDRVIYLSSLSKVMAPGMRIGWMVAAPSLVRRCAIAKQSVDLCSSTWTQAAAAVYLEAGRLDAHIERARRVYAQRAQAMQTALHDLLGERFAFERPGGGMFIWGKFSDGISAQAVLEHAIRAGVVFVPGTAFYADQPEGSTARLCFSMCTPERIGEGVARLRRALDACAA